jgi:hypothetical protein
VITLSLAVYVTSAYIRLVSTQSSRLPQHILYSINKIQCQNVLLGRFVISTKKIKILFKKKIEFYKFFNFWKHRTVPHHFTAPAPPDDAAPYGSSSCSVTLIFNSKMLDPNPDPGSSQSRSATLVPVLMCGTLTMLPRMKRPWTMRHRTKHPMDRASHGQNDPLD